MSNVFNISFFFFWIGNFVVTFIPSLLMKRNPIVTEVINITSDWKQMSNSKVNQQQIKCELRTLIKL